MVSTAYKITLAALGYFPPLAVLAILLSDTVAGFIARGAWIAAPLYWAGAVSSDTAEAIAFWHLF